MSHGQLFYDQIRSGGVSVKTGNYTVVEADAWSLIALAPVSSPLTTYTVTLPAAPSGFRRANWWVSISNYGGGIVSISPNGRTLDGSSSNITLAAGQSVVIDTDGSNYFTQRGMGSGGSSITLQTNSVNNGSQSKLNLVAGSNVTLTDDGVGDVTIAASGGGGGAMVLISEQVLSGAAASVTFSSIPQTFDTLRLEIKARCSDAGVGNVGIAVELNGDTGSNYSREFIGVNNGATAAGHNLATTPGNAAMALATAASADANEAAVTVVLIPRYASTTFNKSGISNVTTMDSTTASQTYQIGWKWNNTAAITSITLVDASGGNFLAGCSFALYGIGGGGALATPSGFQLYDGANYWNFSPAFKCTPPVASTFSWVNQGSATETASGGQLYLHSPDLDNTGVHLRVASIGTNTQLIATIVPVIWGYLAPGSNNANSCVVFRESATGKLVEITFAFDNQQPLVIAAWSLNSPTVFNVEMVKTTVGRTFPYITVKLQKTGGNIILSYSFDGGANYVQLLSEAQTAHFTTAPDQWGYGAESHSVYAATALTSWATS